MALTKITDKQVTYKEGGTGSVVRNLGDKLRESVSVLDFGIVAGDSGARAANTANLLAAWANTNVHTLHFPATSDVYYFNEFYIPLDKTVGLVGSAPKGATGVHLDIDASVSGVAINTYGGPDSEGISKASRNSVLRDLQISTNLTSTAIQVANGGLVIENVHVRQSSAALYLLWSYTGSYKNLILSGATYGLRIGNGSSADVLRSDNRANYFENVSVNCLPSGTVPVVGSAGIFIDTPATSICVGNTFVNTNVEGCQEGVLVRGRANSNTYFNTYFENNFTRNWSYTNFQPDGVTPVSQDDLILNYYVGAPGAVLSADLFSTYGGRVYVGDCFFQGVTTNRINFPANQVPSASPNTLDDYDEGAWEPVLTPDGGTITMNSAASAGLYTKVGRLVTVTGVAVVTSVSSPTGNVSMTGLPFISANTLGSASPVNVYAYGFNATMTTIVVGGIDQNNSAVTLQKTNGAGTVAVLGPDIQAGTSINFSCTYMAA